MERIHRWLAVNPAVVSFAFLGACWFVATAIVGRENPWHTHDIAALVGGFGGLLVARVIQYRYYVLHRPAPVPTVRGEHASDEPLRLTYRT